ncbi:MAG TPA: tetratricopeptide repeat protein [Rhodanobacteraceae bacterium]|nr:tetratricopeptide repeat protein [Rhodanobacteraceae bacterium]
MRSFLRELKRRNVYKVGAMYAVGGWLLVQVATQVLPLFEVSALAQRLIVLVVVAGFPIALVLSWVYEVTPQGIARTAEIAPEQSITGRTGQRLNIVIIAALILAVAFLLVQHYVLPNKAAVAVGPINEKSVAVLPFENLSDEKSNAYFAEGIQDEILTRLAKIGALKVISRTSTQHYASNPGNLPEIARQLGVANILEGSVQKAGDAVHINVQLIRAATDDHLWAEVYNRKLDDIFGVEGEVAGAIAEALNAKLSGAEQAAVAKRPTENLAAYEAYLRARALQTKGYDFATTRKVAAAYAEAVRLDPQFALAWAERTRIEGYLYFNNVDTDTITAESLKQATDTALRLQPKLSEAMLAKGSYLYRVQRDFAGAQKVYEEVLQQSPNDHDALQDLGLVERRQGHWEQALAHLQRALVLDPLNAGLLTTVGGETLLNMRRFKEAHEALDRALAIAPNDGLALSYKVSAYQAEGKLEEAARILEQVPSDGIDPGLASYRAYQRLLERRFPVAIGEITPLLSKSDDALNGFGPLLTLYLGTAQRANGDAAAATATFERLIAQLQPKARRVDDSLAPVVLAQAYAEAGKHAAALDQARLALELFGNDANMRPTAQVALAQVLMMGGDAEGAIEILKTTLPVAGAFYTAALLRLDPLWDPLRGNPRFEALLK